MIFNSRMFTSASARRAAPRDYPRAVRPAINGSPARSAPPARRRRSCASAPVRTRSPSRSKNDQASLASRYCIGSRPDACARHGAGRVGDRARRIGRPVDTVGANARERCDATDRSPGLHRSQRELLVATAPAAAGDAHGRLTAPTGRTAAPACSRASAPSHRRDQRRARAPRRRSAAPPVIAPVPEQPCGRGRRLESIRTATQSRARWNARPTRRRVWAFPEPRPPRRARDTSVRHRGNARRPPQPSRISSAS